MECERALCEGRAGGRAWGQGPWLMGSRPVSLESAGGLLRVFLSLSPAAPTPIATDRAGKKMTLPKPITFKKAVLETYECSKRPRQPRSNPANTGPVGVWPTGKTTPRDEIGGGLTVFCRGGCPEGHLQSVGPLEGSPSSRIWESPGEG